MCETLNPKQEAHPEAQTPLNPNCNRSNSLSGMFLSFFMTPSLAVIYYTFNSAERRVIRQLINLIPPRLQI